jgi:hypothetical protein
VNNPLDNGKSDAGFEEELRRFRPLLVFAAAAALLAALVIVAKSPRREDNTGRSHIAVPRTAATVVSFRHLNSAFRSSDKDLEQMLDEASPQLLSREHRGTALFELAKE